MAKAAALATVATAVALMSSTASSQDTGAEAAPSGGWTFTVSPYFWGASVDGDVTIGGVEADVEQDLDDILDDLTFGAMLLVEARKDRFGLGLNGFAVRTEADAEGPGNRLEIDATTDTASLDATAFYRVLEWKSGSEMERSRTTLGLEPYAGVRLTYVRAELDGELDLDAVDAAAERQVDSSEFWADPIVGAQAILRLGESWSFRVGGDFGGFGVGSDYTWNVQGIVGYDTTLGGFDTVLGVGYRALHWNYDDGGFEMDLTQRGPVVGAAIRF